VSKESNDDLPPGWESASLAALCQLNPSLDRCVVDDAVEVNFVPMRAVESEGAGLVRPEVRPYGEVKKGYTSFLSGDVIMAKITPCMENGKTTVVPDLPGSVCFGSTEFHVIRPETDVLARWIAGFLVQHEVRRSAQRAMTGGVGQMRVPAAFLESLRIPIAPTAEQERIADALDELLSDLDAGVAALERVRNKLKLYRAAVLKAAVEGALTAEWRKQHQQTEPASELLKRILAERRRRWEEEQLRKFKEKGREPPKNWKAKYKKPVAPDTTSLPPLPEGWCWASLDEAVSESLIGLDRGMEHQKSEPPGVPYVKMNNVTMDGRLMPDGMVFVEVDEQTKERFRLREHDLLFNTRNSKELVGKVGLVTGLPEAAIYNNNLMRIRMDGIAIPAFLCFQMCSVSFRARMERVKKATTSVAAVYAKDLFPLPVAVPPVAEQQAIVEAVEDQLSVIDHLEADLDAKLTNAQALRQSILRDAFSGKLVPQDPNDEPASDLLKRIAAEREQRAREAAAAKRLNGHKPRRASKPRGKAARAKPTNKKEPEHGRIADR
jgi:type I restriction enzyme S subunit